MSDESEFAYGPAVRATIPLLLGVAGPTGSGKTYSALRLASGMQQVTGGDIALIDTEAKRATAYIDRFKFNHLDFPPPFGPDRYQRAIKYVIAKGAKIVVVDSMSHEHSGEGGVMDQIEAFLDKKCGNDYACRDKNNMLAHKIVKPARKELNNYITQAGREGVNFIFCYRADEKVKPVKGEGIVNMGMTPETTSKLVYEMMAMFLLSAAADGKPIFNPSTPMEKIFTKLPIQFRDMLAAGEPLSETLGKKFAEWALGPTSEKEVVVDETLIKAGNEKAALGVKELREWWGSIPPGKQKTMLAEKHLPDWKRVSEAKGATAA